MHYVVNPGDSLYSIASWNGLSVEELIEANGLTEADPLYVGQTIVLPRSLFPGPGPGPGFPGPGPGGPGFPVQNFALQQRIARLEQQNAAQQNEIQRLNQRVNRLENEVDRLRGRLINLEQRVDRLQPYPQPR
ncbi:LysM peptidoglycan-binding domain-containing protein [Paenibacillus koleovorans]|uniref:LysM peptidoglycan-binding domain-containing protein n=1 Tax=Paenibacillus koleovorans TaxID=121608 RepID=UPI000FDCAB89|nr:LysM peptidoglycan-binding domain-containing protein [Paenibacillus koleovorans]